MAANNFFSKKPAAPAAVSTPEPNHPEETPVTTNPAPPPVSKAETQPATPPVSAPVVLVSELDAYVRELQLSEPQSLQEALAKVESVDQPGVHALSLPDFFERLSFDCTRGDTCQIHHKETHEVEGFIGIRRTKVTNPGPFVFRWVGKNKRALDEATTLRGWMFCNKTLFKEAPRALFGANGASERGDAVLMFMPVERALKLRRGPSERSIERLRGRMTPDKEDPRKVLMTGDPESPNVYMPDLTKESGEGVVPEEPGITVT